MSGNPNWLAFLAEFSWPLVAVWLFRTRPLNLALIWTILGAHMLLPVRATVKLEMIPELDKLSIPSLAALAGCLFITGRPLKIWHRFGLTEILVLMCLVGPFISSMLNGDTVYSGARTLPGVGIYDGLSAVEHQFIFLIPFFLGRQYLNELDDIEKILKVIVMACLFYSLLMLFEIRMSPQLHTWIYGYFPHSQFFMNMRYGGFRPVVFMDNGLMVAFFTMTAAVASTALWRTRTRLLRVPPGGVTAYLTAMLILCKSGASLVYGTVLIPLVRFATPRLHVRLAVVLAVGALLYPALRAQDLIPTKFLLDTAASISPERAASLDSRFREEQDLLGRASQRPLFGWGRFGRARIYDAKTGEDISTTDGFWIGTLGDFGLFGFFTTFGLLALPVFRAASALRLINSIRDRVFFSALTLIVAIGIVDLIPNAFLSPWAWLLEGALLGRAEALRVASQKKAATPLYTGPLTKPTGATVSSRQA
jgi:hypothetical protein